MIQRLKAPVSVLLAYDHKKRKAYPRDLIWDGHHYPVTKIGMSYHKRVGRTLYHIFSVLGGSLYFKLVLNTDTLNWELEEIDDGETN